MVIFIISFIFHCCSTETSPVLSIIAASVSFVIIILIMVVFILFCRRTKKRLKPADVIPAVSIHLKHLRYQFFPLIFFFCWKKNTNDNSSELLQTNKIQKYWKMLVCLFVRCHFAYPILQQIIHTPTNKKTTRLTRTIKILTKRILRDAIGR